MSMRSIVKINPVLCSELWKTFVFLPFSYTFLPVSSLSPAEVGACRGWY